MNAQAMFGCVAKLCGWFSGRRHSDHDTGLLTLGCASSQAPQASSAPPPQAPLGAAPEASQAPPAERVPQEEVEPQLQKHSGKFHNGHALGPKPGEGPFAQVRLAQSASNESEVYAVKILDLRGDDHSSKSHRWRAQHEVEMCQRLGQHPHVVTFAESYIEDALAYFIMEKCESNLLNLLERVPLLTEKLLAQVFRGMLLGIAHTHECGVVHRDIKPENCENWVGLRCQPCRYTCTWGKNFTC